MYGKHFAAMYEGSMIGKGAVFFAVWGYIIAHSKPDKKVGTQVEINPKLLAFVLGESEASVIAALHEMQQPDPASRTPDEQGRKIIKIGEYSYQVVNGEKYRAIRDEEIRREQNRNAQSKYRAKLRPPMPKTAGEIRAEQTGEMPND